MSIKLLYIDLFCGAGGTSTGVEAARYNGQQCAKVIACVNHDPCAIASHAANHPDALHFTEDIRTLELSPLKAHVQKMKHLYPDAMVVLWASLECTNFSNAKGGLPRDADSRTLAEHLFRYIETIDPDYIQIENVREFMSWGPLDENGKPVSREKGTSYLRWVQNVQHYGYDYDWRILNSADFGAYTTRRRYFGQFPRKGLPFAWPEPTHSRDGGDDSLFGRTEKWKPVREVLDLEDKGKSIFDRKKPLADKTLERIYAGLVKFVAGGEDNFIQQRNSGNPEYKVIPTSGPARTVTTTGGNQEIVQVEKSFMVKYNSMNRSGKYVPPSVDEPCPVIACQNRLGVTNVEFLTKHFSGNPAAKNIPLDGPAGTITCKDHHAMVSVGFLSAYYGSGKNNTSIEQPCPTVTTKDRFNVVQPEFLANYYSGGGQHSSIDNPCPALLGVPKQRVVSCAFIDQQFGQSKPTGTDRPLGALTTKDKYSVVRCDRWLLNPQYESKGGSIDNPCFTLIARMDKLPPYLMATETGAVRININETDSPAMQKIKVFMAVYGISDIFMRMLNIPEMKRIMGFPEDYVLTGTQEQQKKHIGNAVETTTAKVQSEALVTRLVEYFRKSKIA